MSSLVSIVLSVWNTVFRGYVIKTFWFWFLIPLFPSLPHLAILPAIGLSYLVGAFSTWKGFSQEEWEKVRASNSAERTTLGLINGFVYTIALAFTLLGGYIIHCLM